MSGAKEIRTKVKSIRSTQKITRAMEMVAASKMRKAQQRMLASRPYATHISDVIEHLSRCHSEYRHPYLCKHDSVKKVGIIVVSTDRGLCGGLNSNLFKFVLKEFEKFNKQSIEVEMCVFGVKGATYFSRVGAKIIAKAQNLGDNPTIAKVIGPVGVMLRAFEKGDIDELYLSYNEFLTTMSQQPVLKQLLPVSFEERSDDKKSNGHWDYIYEPDAKELLDFLLKRYMESQAYQATVENFSCEQAARMVAMKSASDNASEMIDDLQLAYNKARQATITQELSEIVSGAAAV